MNTPSILLFPQTIPYPSFIEKSLKKLDKFLVLQLPLTEEKWKTGYQELLPKVEFLKFKKDKIRGEDFLKKHFYQLKEWALYLRDLENLKILEKYKDLWRGPEGFNFFKEDDPLSPEERAILVLMLAEDIDFNMSEAEKGIQTFEKKMEELFQKGLLIEESFNSLKHFQETTLPGTLFNLSLRIKMWKILFPWIDFSFSTGVKLLLTEKEWGEELEALSLLSEPKVVGLVFLSDLNG